MKKIILVLAVVLIGVGTAVGQEDAYHQALRTQLETDYGVTGGEFILAETEDDFYSSMQVTNVSRSKIDWDGEEPFTQVIELNIPNRGQNAWDNAVRAETEKAIQEGDVLLWVVWFKGIEATEGFGHVTNVFEMTGSPYTKSLSQGGDLTNEWAQWMLPFEADVDYPAGGGRFQLNLGHMEGKIQIAGAAIINFGDAYNKEDLPVTEHHLNYAGREDGAQWRIDALNRIEQIRKGDMTIKVVNANGDVMKNAEVDVNMAKHWFGFGTAISARWWETFTDDADMYLETLEDLTGDGRTFSVVVFENATKWGPWEADNYLGTKDDVAEIIDWCQSLGMRVRGHNLVWPRWSSLPDDLEANQDDPDYIETRIHDHIMEEAGWDGIKGVIDEWDVINEMTHNKVLEDIFGGYDCYVDWITWAHETDPNAILYINDYSIINGGAHNVSAQEEYKNILQYIVDAGAPLHGLGIQGHFGANFTPPARVVEVFNDFEQFNLDMSITEYDASGAPPQIAADYMRDILIASFAQPGMRNFLMWGFWDGSHWHSDAPMFYQDWTLKPSGETFIDWVFDEWWTNEAGTTARNGYFNTRGFYGTYDITASYGDVSTTITVDFDPDFDEEIVITLDTEETAVNEESGLPAEFALDSNYPNPFNPGTTIRYGLPEHAFVELDVYDATGRLVKNLVSGRQPAGYHTVELDGSDLASGVYHCRLAANGELDMMKIMLVK